MANTHVGPIQAFLVPYESTVSWLTELEGSNRFGGKPQMFTEAFLSSPIQHLYVALFVIFQFMDWWVSLAPTVIYFMFQSRTISLWIVQWQRYPFKKFQRRGASWSSS